MKPQYKIPMPWPRGTMFIEAINWKHFKRHCRNHSIELKRGNDNKEGKK